MSFCPQCGREVEEGGRFCPACGAAVGEAAAAPRPAAGQQEDPLLGRTLDGKFRIEKLLGLGGMGRVYQARQLSLDKVVCVKVLHAGMNADPTLVGRFQREARAASRLNHPNSITVIDFGQDSSDGSLYLAMEYVAGRDLGRVIREDFPLDEARIVHVMDQVMSALADAHAAGIIHRDLKPENIMVSELRGTRDFVKVLDFGIAKIQESTNEPGLTQVGMVCGTPEYMSPEQARGEPLDARSDLYAAGVILYQMVTGKLPFLAPTAMGIVTKHLTEPPLPPSQVPGIKVSPALEKLILKALSKNREGRPATALAMQQELARVVNPMVAPAQQQVLGNDDLFAAAEASGEAPRPEAVPGPGAGGEVEQRPAGTSSRKGPWLVLAVVLLVALAAGGYFVLGGRKVERADAGQGAGVVDAGGAAGVEEAVRPVDAGVDGGPASGAVGAAADSGADAGRAATAGDGSGEIPEAARQFYLAGKELMVRNRLPRAIKAFSKAVSLYPGFAAAHKALGTCYMRLGRIKRAKRSFRAYLKYAPRAPDAAQFRELIESL